MRPAVQTCVPPVERTQAAALLSQTGCVDPMDPKKPAASVVPYDVASPLWSDNADKLRYFALPVGTTLTVKDCERDGASCQPGAFLYNSDEGDWDFPDGTVLVKSFAFGERLVETRLLIRVDQSTWWGYSYEWRADQSDADLLAANTDGYERVISTPSGAQTWHFPSRSQCLVCHTDTSGRALGPETSQMNMDFSYPNGVRANQIETLVHAGFFAPGQEPRLRPAYPNPADTTAPIEARARSYLHSNCAICHRPGAESATLIDLRFDAAFNETLLCNVVPEKGDLSVSGALRILPGEPDRSLLSMRMKSLDTMIRMPRIGTRVVDEVGVGVIDQWIESLSSCPE